MIVRSVTRDADAVAPRARGDVGAVDTNVDLIVVGIDQTVALSCRLVDVGNISGCRIVTLEINSG